MALANINRKYSQGKSNILANVESETKKVVISFKYLHKCNIHCFNELAKFHRNNKEKKVFDDLQRFLFEAEECPNVEKMIAQYTSQKGSTIDAKNEYVKNIIKKFKKAYPDKKTLISDRLVHIHTKRGGAGEFVIFGTNYDGTFYVLAFDPGHDFSIKKH